MCVVRSQKPRLQRWRPEVQLVMILKRGPRTGVTQSRILPVPMPCAPKQERCSTCSSMPEHAKLLETPCPKARGIHKPTCPSSSAALFCKTDMLTAPPLTLYIATQSRAIARPKGGALSVSKHFPVRKREPAFGCEATGPWARWISPAPKSGFNTTVTRAIHRLAWPSHNQNHAPHTQRSTVHMHMLCNKQASLGETRCLLSRCSHLPALEITLTCLTALPRAGQAPDQPTS